MITKQELDEMKAALKVADDAYVAMLYRCGRRRGYGREVDKAVTLKDSADFLIDQIEDFMEARSSK